MLWVAALMLAAANFIAVLDMTIANVAVPHIAGGLGAPQPGHLGDHLLRGGRGIIVPLTGWLAGRFGSVRVFVASMSVRRFLGPVRPRERRSACWSFPRLAGPVRRSADAAVADPADAYLPEGEARPAIGLWSMTTLVAPVSARSWAAGSPTFHLELDIPDQRPDRLLSAYRLALLKRYEERRAQADRHGGTDPAGHLGGRAAAVLDEGKDLDWFASTQIARWPSSPRRLRRVPDLGAHREAPDGRPAGVPAPRLHRRRAHHHGFAAFFGVNVLTPLWLQSFMGYTATSPGSRRPGPA